VDVSRDWCVVSRGARTVDERRINGLSGIIWE